MLVKVALSMGGESVARRHRQPEARLARLHLRGFQLRLAVEIPVGARHQRTQNEITHATNSSSVGITTTKLNVSTNNSLPLRVSFVRLPVRTMMLTARFIPTACTSVNGSGHGANQPQTVIATHVS